MESLFDKKIYLDITSEELLKRRLLRNINEDESFIYKGVIEPSKKYEKIQKKSANLVINSEKEINEILKEIEDYIKF